MQGVNILHLMDDNEYELNSLFFRARDRGGKGGGRGRRRAEVLSRQNHT